MIRPPVVAGVFYPAGLSELRHQLSSFIPDDTPKAAITAAILPHAGYRYSGHVAGSVVGRILVPRQVVLLGPNHQGSGASIAVSGADAWMTPLGPVEVAADLRAHLLEEIPELMVDDRAHRQEHSLEVLIPFLSYVQPDLRIVPIALKHLDLPESTTLGSGLAKALKDWGQPVLLIASSDMNHFLPARENSRLDSMAIDAMTDLDPRRLYQVVARHGISMCGVLPVVSVMTAALDLGAQRCELVRYSHSGEAGGDNSRVVGYAGLIIA